MQLLVFKAIVALAVDGAEGAENAPTAEAKRLFRQLQAQCQVYFAHYEASARALHTTPERRLFCRAYSALREALVVAYVDQRHRRLIAPRALEARLRATREHVLLVVQVRRARARSAAPFRRAPGSSARAVHCARSQLNTPGAAQRGARHELDFRRASEFRPLSMADAGLGFVSLGKAE